MGGRPSYPARQFRQRQWLFLRTHASMLSRVVVVGALTVAFFSATALAALPHTMATGWVLGVGQTGVVMAFLLLLRSVHFSRDPDAVRFYRGALGESNTADLLDQAERRGLVWGRLDGLSTRGGDVDHLVVTCEAGLWAIDSTFLSSTDHLESAARSALASARRAQSVLRSERALRRETTARHREDRASFTVRPLIVLWGAAQGQVPAETDVSGVRVVRGDHLSTFVRQQTGEPVSKDVATDLLRALEAFRSRVRT